MEFSRGVKLIQVDIDVAEIGRNYPVDLGIVADARTFLRQLLAACGARRWRARRRHGRRNRRLARGMAGLHAAELRDATRRRASGAGGCRGPPVLPDDAILSLDFGVHHNWFMQFWEARQPQTMLNAWGFSAMGFGVSGILGAKLAAPDRPCVSVCGDGGFTMTPHVLCTAVEHDIPCVWVIWNNFVWGAIRDIQYGLFGGREYGTGFYHGPIVSAGQDDLSGGLRGLERRSAHGR